MVPWTRPSGAAALPLALMALLAVGCGRAEEERGARGVLVVTVDTLRRDHVGAFGADPSPTPEIDRVAAEGIVLADAYTPVPITLPAHASLFTGLEPARHGVRDNGSRRVPAEARTLAERLAERGWRTGASVAALPLDPGFGLDQGFESYGAPPRSIGGLEINVPERRADEVVDEALARIEELARGEAPFLYWVHVYDPHAPYHAPGGPAAVALRGEDVRPAYGAEVRFADRELGRLFARLRELGLWDELCVVVASDHGEGLDDGEEPTHGYLVHDTTMRIPLVLKHPALAPGRFEEPASLVDVLPTLLRLLDVPADPREFDGRDLVQALRGEASGDAAPLVPIESHLGWIENGWAPIEGAVKGPLKLVRAGGCRAYDRSTDPLERANLCGADDPRWGELLSEVEEVFERLGARRLAAEGASLDEGAEMAFAALGYAGAGGGAEDRELPDDRSELADPREMLPLVERLSALSVALGAGDLEAATDELRALVAADPENAMFLQRLGQALLWRGPEHVDEAEEALVRAVRLRPRLVGLRNALATCARIRADEARRRADEARAAGDEEAAARAGAERAEHAARSIEELRAALALDPTHGTALANLATSLAEESRASNARGDYAAALRLREEALELVERLLAVVDPADPLRGRYERLRAELR